jgi:hypothetical protein
MRRPSRRYIAPNRFVCRSYRFAILSQNIASLSAVMVFGIAPSCVLSADMRRQYKANFRKKTRRAGETERKKPELSETPRMGRMTCYYVCLEISSNGGTTKIADQRMIR